MANRGGNLKKASAGRRPAAWFVGDENCTDFRDAMARLRADTNLKSFAQAPIALGTSPEAQPELIVVAPARPGEIRLAQVESLRRRFPLAGFVSLLGSWCEGHLRTGRHLPGADWVYWHEFPAWWARQMALFATGHCPDWARPDSGDRSRRIDPIGTSQAQSIARGLVVLRTARWETADALGDALDQVGLATVWQPAWRAPLCCRGATTGIWEGGQLSDCEGADLARFCQRLARDAAPVVAILDFPRRDSLTRATNLGAATVLGKPWYNAELVATIRELFTLRSRPYDIADESSAA